MRGEEPHALASAIRRCMESPPRARGRAVQEPLSRVAIGITPACAGKRCTNIKDEWKPRNHPRVRGEEWTSVSASLFCIESPPHARGRGFRVDRRGRLIGITPACAGKRLPRSSRSCWQRNHPRVRGEERWDFVVKTPDTGITPACAGKRMPSHPWGRHGGNHPRMSGEESNENVASEGITTPPRLHSPLFFKSYPQAPRDSRTRGRGLFNYQASQPTLCVPAGRGHQTTPEFLR